MFARAGRSSLVVGFRRFCAKAAFAEFNVSVGLSMGFSIPFVRIGLVLALIRCGTGSQVALSLRILLCSALLNCYSLRIARRSDCRLALHR